jgi:nucleoside-diphosphate-sugar epimerase
MRVLVLGGTGFIGPHVVQSLAGMGHEVTVFHRGQTEAELPTEVRHLHAPELQLAPNCNIDRWTDDFRRLHPEVVLYMVPIGEQDAEGVMSTFNGIARRVVAISSIDVYRAYGVLHRTEAGPPEPVPLTEDAPLRQKLYPYRGDPPTKSPEEPGYWYDKILAERRVMSDPQLAGTVLRLPMVYGPGDGLHRLFPYLKRMDDQRPAILMDESLAGWRGSRGYVENIAAAIVLALIDERAAGRIYNVAEPEPLKEVEWVRRIGQVAGWSGEVVVVPKDRLPEHLRWPANLEQQFVVDSTRMRGELGFRELLSPAESLRRTVEWERARPPEKIDPAAFNYAAEDAALVDSNA